MSFRAVAFGLSGRIGRLTYLWATLLSWALVPGLKFLVPLLPREAALVLLIFIFVIFAWVAAVVTVKRLHDIGMAGANLVWIVLLAFANYAARSVPAISVVLLLADTAVGMWLLFQPGQLGPNRYGAPPT
jgi:uncharacterized membrane protein YhaH (DUF805 family)